MLLESLALGGMFAAGADCAILLALLLALVGPVCGAFDWFRLADQDAILGAIMLFATGASCI